MSIPSSVEELLQLIRKSGMIDTEKLNNYIQRRQVGRGGLAQDPREAADQLIRDGILTYFQAEQFLLGKWRGFTIGKYKLLERIGVGGMGQVFLAEHMYMKRHLALKVLPPAKAEQPAALGRFYREARAAGALDHENLVRTSDIDQDGNLHYIVMEYVCGSNLLDIVRKFGPLDIGRAVHYISQAAKALEYAFKNGIIHRDVKPGNIIINKHGVAKVLDMGLARFFQDQNDLLTVKYDDKIVLGTADYVAPEQVANSHKVDIRADIYALGASLYFLLAGHPPFPAGTVSQKLVWHRTKDPSPIRQIRAEVPEGLAEIVAKMMAKSPVDRYQTPGDVARDLARWLPAVVPLPSPAEMPQLSPAAAEAVGLTGSQGAEPEQVSQPVPTGAAIVSEHDTPPRSTLRPKTLTGSDIQGVSARSEVPVPPTDYGPASPMKEPPRQSRLNPSPFAPSPFAPPSDRPRSRAAFHLDSESDVATAGLPEAHDPTPSTPAPSPDRRLPVSNPVSLVHAPAPAASQFDSKTIVYVACAAVSVVVMIVLMLLKF